MEIHQTEQENEFSPEMTIAYSFIEYTGRNIFITGKAGTGKTYFLNLLTGRTSKKHVVLAPTGVAAVNAKGVTVNSLFQVPPGLFLSDLQSPRAGVHSIPQIVEELNYSPGKKDLLRQLELIIIDEVSMLRCDQVELIDRILKKVRGNEHPFGGIQMVLIGDLFQLPPIISNEVSLLFFKEYKSVFFFAAEVIMRHPLLQIEFTKVQRQTDNQFIDILNRIRANRVTDQDLSLLNKKFRPSLQLHKIEHYIHITSHNLEANNINRHRLKSLPVTERVFEATIKGDFQDTQIPAEKELRIKEGARVMLIRNDSNATKRYYNGKIGEVISISDDVIEIRFDDSDTHAVNRAVWQTFDYENGSGQMVPVGEFVQFPLKLAWAVTIHKSQGLTFDRAVIDAGKSFSAGQVYVALSRIKNLDGLLLTSQITRASIHSSDNIVDYLTNAESNDLQGELIKGKTTYWLSLLVDRFSLESVLDSLSQILRKPQTYKQKVGVQAVNELEDVFRTLNKLHDLYRKFRDEIMKNSEEGIDARHLEKRMNDAICYFTKVVEIEVFSKLSTPESTSKVKGNSLANEHMAFVSAQLRRWGNMIRQTPGLARKFNHDHLEKLIEESRLSLPPLQPIKDPSKSRSTQNKRGTHNKSLQVSIDLLRLGKTVPEIAQERNLSIGTIENHVLEAAKSGEPAAMALLPQEAFEVIAKLIGEAGTDIHDLVDKLDRSYSFFEIRLALIRHHFIKIQSNSV